MGAVCCCLKTKKFAVHSEEGAKDHTASLGGGAAEEWRRRPSRLSTPAPKRSVTEPAEPSEACSAAPVSVSSAPAVTTEWARRPGRLSTPAPRRPGTAASGLQDACDATVAILEIPPERIDPFLRAMEGHVTEIRQHPRANCMRLDLLRDQADSSKFLYYECYSDEAAAAAAALRRSPVDLAFWDAHPDSGPLAAPSVHRLNTTSIPGSWGLQPGPAALLGDHPDAAASSSVVSMVEVKPDCIDEFLRAAQKHARQMRNKLLDPGCLRFDLLRDSRQPHRFIMYEVYADDNALQAHQETQHAKVWESFEASGSISHKERMRFSTPTIDGGWALQARSPPAVTVCAS